MVPYRPAPPRAPRGPPRPGMIRRQSSLDTFDRRPSRRHDEYRGGERDLEIDIRHQSYKPPPVIDLPRPRPQEPHRSTGRYTDRGREEDYYRDIGVSQPDYYGDDTYRTVREREWVRNRSRARSKSRSRSRSSSASARESVRESVRSGRRGKYRDVEEERTEHIILEEKPWPRKGKTRVPRRLAHTTAIRDLGYPYHEEVSRDDQIVKSVANVYRPSTSLLRLL